MMRNFEFRKGFSPQILGVYLNESPVAVVIRMRDDFDGTPVYSYRMLPLAERDGVKLSEVVEAFSLVVT